MGKNQDPDPEWVKIKIWIRDEHPGAYFRELIKNFWVKTNEEFKNPNTPNSINLKGRRWNWQLAAEKKEFVFN
jgi:hypothetical protein